MSVEYSLHFWLAIWSVLAGFAFGFLYEFFRLAHRLHPRLYALIFLEDLLFCTLCACGMLLLFFNLSYGRMRMYAFVGVLIGFAVWYFTFGKLFRIFLMRLSAFIRPRVSLVSSVIRTRICAMCLVHHARHGFGTQKIIKRK